MDFSGGALVDVAGLPANVIHQQVLAERIGRREIRLATAQLRYFLHEMNQAIVAREHESIDKYSGTLAFCNFLKRLCHNQRVQTKSIFVNAAIFESKSRGLAIRDHHDLPHILLLAGKNALREPKPLSRV